MEAFVVVPVDRSKTIFTTSVSVFGAPARNGESFATASFLNSPITVSAAAFSWASTTLPMEDCGHSIHLY
ncbi:hypothetical protein GCM10027027_21220 [Neomicrococcus lactis]